MSNLIRRGDTVIVVAGKDKGKTAKVKTVIPGRGKVVLERINLVKRNTKPSRSNPQGGVMEIEAPLDVSNVMLYCPKCTRGVRAGIKVSGDGTKTRLCKSCEGAL